MGLGSSFRLAIGYSQLVLRWLTAVHWKTKWASVLFPVWWGLLTDCQAQHHPIGSLWWYSVCLCGVSIPVVSLGSWNQVMPSRSGISALWWLLHLACWSETWFSLWLLRWNIEYNWGVEYSNIKTCLGSAHCAATPLYFQMEGVYGSRQRFHEYIAPPP